MNPPQPKKQALYELLHECLHVIEYVKPRITDPLGYRKLENLSQRLQPILQKLCDELKEPSTKKGEAGK